MPGSVSDRPCPRSGFPWGRSGGRRKRSDLEPLGKTAGGRTARADDRAVERWSFKPGPVELRLIIPQQDEGRACCYQQAKGTRQKSNKHQSYSCFCGPLMYGEEGNRHSLDLARLAR